MNTFLIIYVVSALLSSLYIYLEYQKYGISYNDELYLWELLLAIFCPVLNTATQLYWLFWFPTRKINLAISTAWTRTKGFVRYYLSEKDFAESIKRKHDKHEE